MLAPMLKSKPDATRNEYSATALSRGKTEEILGKVQHSGATVTIFRYGKPIARIVPIVDGDALVTDPTTRLPITPTSQETRRG